jgi:anti-sigma regulatory factor (Ser/Thr protein kinase)
MQKKLILRTAGGRDAARRARAEVEALNGPPARVCEDIKLLVTELITNSVRHSNAGPDSVIELELSTSPKRIRAQATDCGPGFEPRPRPEQEKFGLLLVERISDRWGVEQVHGKTRTWFEIDSSQ